MTLFTWNSRYGLPVSREGCFAHQCLCRGAIVSREGRFSARCWLRGAGCVERVAGGRAGDEPARSWWGRHWGFLEYS